jgi:hypothetical protein
MPKTHCFVTTYVSTCIIIRIRLQFYILQLNRILLLLGLFIKYIYGMRQESYMPLIHCSRYYLKQYMKVYGPYRATNNFRPMQWGAENWPSGLQNFATVNGSFSVCNESMARLPQRAEQWDLSFSLSWFWQLNYSSDTDRGMKSDAMREASAWWEAVFVEGNKVIRYRCSVA